MDDREITALAKGMVPFVRECVAEALVVPPDLAGQVASAVRLLHESPPVQRSEAPPPSAARIARIERNDEGHLVPVYDR